ncbi:MAG: hypothetical protein ACKPFK_32610, partial [Dolichospermum sp.]
LHVSDGLEYVTIFPAIFFLGINPSKNVVSNLVFPSERLVKIRQIGNLIALTRCLQRRVLAYLG